MNAIQKIQQEWESEDHHYLLRVKRGLWRQVKHRTAETGEDIRAYIERLIREDVQK